MTKVFVMVIILGDGHLQWKILGLWAKRTLKYIRKIVKWKLSLVLLNIGIKHNNP